MAPVSVGDVLASGRPQRFCHRLPPRGRGTTAVDYNGRVPSASGQPSWRSRLVKPLVLVVVVGGLNTLGAYAERQAISPPDDACTTMLDYFRSAPGGEDHSDAWDRLRYVSDRLDDATAPEAVAIREYLVPYRLNRGPGTGPNELVIETEPEEVELGSRRSPRLMRAAQACTDLGHPELQDYLHDTRDEGQVPPTTPGGRPSSSPMAWVSGGPGLHVTPLSCRTRL
jgi:hypothetical protein